MDRIILNWVWARSSNIQMKTTKPVLNLTGCNCWNKLGNNSKFRWRQWNELNQEIFLATVQAGNTGTLCFLLIYQPSLYYFLSTKIPFAKFKTANFLASLDVHIYIRKHWTSHVYWNNVFVHIHMHAQIDAHPFFLMSFWCLRHCFGGEQ